MLNIKKNIRNNKKIPFTILPQIDPPLNSFSSNYSIYEVKNCYNEETIWKFPHFLLSKKNSFRGNYLQKYGILGVRSKLIIIWKKNVWKKFFLQRVQLLITVVDYDRVGASEPIGKVLLGCDQKGPELRHWSEMLASPRRPVAQWHTLKEIESKSICLICQPKFWTAVCKSS